MTVNTFRSLPTERRTAATWLWPFIPISLSAFSLSALIYYHLHHGMELQSPLQVLYARIYAVFGLAPSVMFFVMTLTWSSIWFATGTIERPLARLGKLVAMAVMLGIFINLGTSGVVADVHKGSLGAWLAGVLWAAFGAFPSLVVVWAITFASFVLATDFFFSDRFERLLDKGAATGEVGVEPAVAEHLRELGSVVLPPVEVATPSISQAVEVDAAPAALPTALPIAAEIEPVEPLVVLRRSFYADRAAERAARREAAQAEAAAAELVVDAPNEEPVVTARPVKSVDEPVGMPVAAPMLDAEAPIAAEESDAASSTDAAPPAEPEASSSGEFPGIAPWLAAAAEGEVGAGSVAEPLAMAADSVASMPFGPEPAPEPAEEQAMTVEPIIAIPRPERSYDAPAEEQAVARPAPTPFAEPVRQQSLFGSGLDEVLLQDAIEVVTNSGRASVALLQRKLRIDYALACDVLAALAARGIVALDGDAASGRVIS